MKRGFKRPPRESPPGKELAKSRINYYTAKSRSMTFCVRFLKLSVSTIIVLPNKSPENNRSGLQAPNRKNRAGAQDKESDVRSHKPGRICDGLWYLGMRESGVYLLEGDRLSMLISGGMSFIVPTVMDQIRDFRIDEDRIAYMLILHSHFDHVGIIPFFKNRHPDVTVYGSARAWETLSLPRSIETINRFGRIVAELLGMSRALSEHDLDWYEGLSGKVVTEGDVLCLGGLDIQILETPGHSSCSISAYVPELKALFPSDGGGVPFKDTIVSAANSNFTLYQESLSRLQPLEVDYMCADHFGYITGDEARQYITRSMERAAADRSAMEQVYARIRDLDAAAKQIADEFYAEHPDYFMPRAIYEGICRQTMKHIAKCMDG